MSWPNSSLGNRFQMPNSFLTSSSTIYPGLVMFLTIIIGIVIIPSWGFGGQEPLSQTGAPQPTSKEDLHEKEIQALKMRVEVLEVQLYSWPNGLIFEEA